jgi:hypothetical protein
MRMSKNKLFILSEALPATKREKWKEGKPLARTAPLAKSVLGRRGKSA